MTVLDEVLLEEYDRAQKIKKSIETEQANLPKGSIQKKTIHGVVCFYLVYRDGDKVKSQYINKSLVDNYIEQIEKRKSNEKAIKELNRNIKKIEKTLGKELIYEHTAKRIY